jgi:putative redox protein
MVTITATYDGNLRCTATHGPSGAKLPTDAPKDNEGMGASFSPTDLVATALATCTITTMGILARREGIDLRGAQVTVEKQMVATPRRRIGALPVTITVPGRLTAQQKQKLENAARTCPVHASLHPDVQAPITFVYPDL